MKCGSLGWNLFLSAHIYLECESYTPWAILRLSHGLTIPLSTTTKKVKSSIRLEDFTSLGGLTSWSSCWDDPKVCGSVSLTSSRRVEPLVCLVHCTSIWGHNAQQASLVYKKISLLLGKILWWWGKPLLHGLLTSLKFIAQNFYLLFNQILNPNLISYFSCKSEWSMFS